MFSKFTIGASLAFVISNKPKAQQMTDEDAAVLKKPRGGSRPGAGRKRLEGAKATTVILTNDLLIQLKRLGGSKWIRSQILASTLPQPDKTVQTLLKESHLTEAELSVEKAPDNSMDAAGIPTGALMLVEKDVQPQVGDIVIIEHIGIKTLRRLVPGGKALRLKAESSQSIHSDYILPLGSQLAHAGIVRLVLFKP